MKQHTKRSKDSTRRTKKICNPISRKNKIINDSCFTPKTIQLLKRIYNHQNPKNKIKNRLPKNILREVQSHPNLKCESDECIIEKVATNKRDKNILKALLFPPAKPADWEKEPNAWLTNFDIMDVLNQYEKSYTNFMFIGPSSIDYDTELYPNVFVCRKLREFSIAECLQKTPQITKIGVIFNLSPHNRKGTHWVAMFINLIDNFIFYFNSSGNPIPQNINKFTDIVKNQAKCLNPPKQLEFHQNTNIQHQESNTECGMYCLYFIITMLLQKREIQYDINEENAKMLSKEELFHLFKNKRITDKFVSDKRNEYFS